ncbi:hypothetical protein FOMPIDRAFT_1048360 [Fomitopsis schrenkii]|uniref:Uncharacterized protein n=1 Tax=Fomitopsis schrenkii TaxID=2126942 RepID=S8FU81_FOMSC|nr:hypothetical protein FOMPIDRAFT_1048360 [Fomitopsis schrenkii]
MAGSIISEAIVLIVTWRRTYSTSRFFRERSLRVSISTLLLRDGTVYFASLFIVNCITIATFFTDLGTMSSYVALILTNILLSRMLLNLREASLRVHDVSTSANLGVSQSTTMSDLRFAQSVRDFGASWNDGEDADIGESEVMDDEETGVEMMPCATAEIGESA